MTSPRRLLALPALLLLPLATLAAAPTWPDQQSGGGGAESYSQGPGMGPQATGHRPLLLDTRAGHPSHGAASASRLAAVSGGAALAQARPATLNRTVRTLPASGDGVPRPSTLALAAMAAVGLFIARRRPSLGA